MNQAYIKPLFDSFKKNLDPANAAGMRAYMRDQFDYCGIKTPLRKALFKEFIKENGLPDLKDLPQIIDELWELPEREFQYCAIELLLSFKKQFTPEHLPLMERMITRKSWWDTVDGVAPNGIGTLFKKYPELIKPKTDEWIEGGNMWLQRTAIIFQLKYKDQTDLDLLFKTILHFRNSKEFFIQKAMGWALREYAWRHPDVIKEFVLKNTLPALTKREALKNIKKVVPRY
jgi:3-methyladenine DNA glycosylase AlkD